MTARHDRFIGKQSLMRRLVKRAQFLQAARGTRTGRSGFSLQAVAASANEPGIGFTVTKKSGNSPERNRIKRRLRAAARACELNFHAQHDYVLVGRREALSEKFSRLVSDLNTAIAKVHRPRGPGSSQNE